MFTRIPFFYLRIAKQYKSHSVKVIQSPKQIQTRFLYICRIQITPDKYEKEILYQEIARTIACQIKKGVWKAGEKLPSLRTISNENGVSLNTAIQAYYELEKDGFIISRPKSGYIVNYKPIRLSVPATTQPSVKPESKEVIDLIADVYNSLEIGDKSITRFSLGMPEDILLPIAKLNKELIRAMQALPGNGTRYDETQGNMRLRKSIARFTYSWKET